MEPLGGRPLGRGLECLGLRLGLLGRTGLLAVFLRRCAELRALAGRSLRSFLRLWARLSSLLHLLAGTSGRRARFFLRSLWRAAGSDELLRLLSSPPS